MLSQVWVAGAGAGAGVGVGVLFLSPTASLKLKQRQVHAIWQVFRGIFFREFGQQLAWGEGGRVVRNCPQLRTLMTGSRNLSPPLPLRRTGIRRVRLGVGIVCFGL